MKTVKVKILTVLSLIALVTIFVSCEKDGELSSNPDKDQVAMVIDDNAEIPIDNLSLILEPELSELSEEIDLRILNDGIPTEAELESTDGKGIISPKLRFLLDKLELSQEQMKKLHYSLKEYNLCRHHLFVQLRKLNQEIINKTNIEKLKLLAKYKAGEISESQFKKELMKLKKHTIYTLKNNPVRKQIIINLQRCHKEFVENMRLILTKAQWEMWINWHKKVGSGK